MRGNKLAPSDAGRALGSIKTPKKTASSSENVKRATEARKAQRKTLKEIPCTCGGGDSVVRSDHAGTCPKWRAIHYREKKGLPLD
jgi:hypothetical protein